MKMSIERARQIAAKRLSKGDFQIRTCGNCNGAHKHLMMPGEGLINCFVCGRWYYNGIDVTVEECDKK